MEMLRRSRRETDSLVFLFILVVVIIIVIIVVIVFVIVKEVAVFRGAWGHFLVIIIVVGDAIQMHGVRLRNFEFGFALGAGQDFAFFDLVFIDVDFSGTFRAADHVSILRWNQRMVSRVIAAAMQRIIYRAV